MGTTQSSFEEHWFGKEPKGGSPIRTLTLEECLDIVGKEHDREKYHREDYIVICTVWPESESDIYLGIETFTKHWDTVGDTHSVRLDDKQIRKLLYLMIQKNLPLYHIRHG